MAVSQDDGAAQSADVGLSQVLEQQITQAVQPTLNEFRQRMTELSKQMAATPIRGAAPSDGGKEAPQGPPAAPEAAPQQPEGEQAPESQPQPALTPVQSIQHAGERALSGTLTSAMQMVGRS